MIDLLHPLEPLAHAVMWALITAWVIISAPLVAAAARDALDDRRAAREVEKLRELYAMPPQQEREEAR